MDFPQLDFSSRNDNTADGAIMGQTINLDKPSEHRNVVADATGNATRTEDQDMDGMDAEGYLEDERDMGIGMTGLAFRPRRFPSCRDRSINPIPDTNS
jgi:hypothetical protein